MIKPYLKIKAFISWFDRLSLLIILLNNSNFWFSFIWEGFSIISSNILEDVLLLLLTSSLWEDSLGVLTFINVLSPGIEGFLNLSVSLLSDVVTPWISLSLLLLILLSWVNPVGGFCLERIFKLLFLKIPDPWVLLKNWLILRSTLTIGLLILFNFSLWESRTLCAFWLNLLIFYYFTIYTRFHHFYLFEPLCLQD